MRFKAVVSEFWAASLTSNNQKIKHIISKAPADYYDMFNQCATQEDLREPQNLLTPKILDPPDYKFLYDGVRDFSKVISKNHFSYFRIASVIRQKNHAVARIQYGEPEHVNNTGYVLLSYTPSGWKVFMIDGGYYLSFDNNYFALNSCSETPVTELSWEPVPTNQSAR